MEVRMELVSLGAGGPRVSRLGLGLTGMSGVYGPADAAEFTLSPGELAAIEAAVPSGPVAGDRYDPGQMTALDSEKPSA
jgi:hypothetical protein